MRFVMSSLNRDFPISVAPQRPREQPAWPKVGTVGRDRAVFVDLLPEAVSKRTPPVVAMAETRAKPLFREERDLRTAPTLTGGKLRLHRNLPFGDTSPAVEAARGHLFSQSIVPLLGGVP